MNMVKAAMVALGLNMLVMIGLAIASVSSDTVLVKDIAIVSFAINTLALWGALVYIVYRLNRDGYAGKN